MLLCNILTTQAVTSSYITSRSLQLCFLPSLEVSLQIDVLQLAFSQSQVVLQLHRCTIIHTSPNNHDRVSNNITNRASGCSGSSGAWNLSLLRTVSTSTLKYTRCVAPVFVCAERYHRTHATIKQTPPQGYNQIQPPAPGALPCDWKQS